MDGDQRVRPRAASSPLTRPSRHGRGSTGATPSRTSGTSRNSRTTGRGCGGRRSGTAPQARTSSCTRSRAGATHGPADSNTSPRSSWGARRVTWTRARRCGRSSRIIRCRDPRADLLGQDAQLRDGGGSARVANMLGHRGGEPGPAFPESIKRAQVLANGGIGRGARGFSGSRSPCYWHSYSRDGGRHSRIPNLDRGAPSPGGLIRRPAQSAGSERGTHGFFTNSSSIWMESTTPGSRARINGEPT